MREDDDQAFADFVSRVVVGEPVEGLATVQTLAADGTVLAETAPMGFVEWE